MTSEKLHDLHTKRPFEPFIIHLADGRKISVPHPEWMLYREHARTAYVEDRTGKGNYVDVMLILDLEVRTNGKHKGRGRRAARRK